MILHLIRHPRPLVDDGICYGQLDLAGENPAAAAAQLRNQLPPGLPVWSSPLRRCAELAAALHTQPFFDHRLAEMNFGNWEGRRWDCIPRHEIDAWAADVAGYVVPGGESALKVQQRALDFVAGLRVPEAVIVTHAGVLRVLLAHWQGLPDERWCELGFAYGSCWRVVVEP
jgi:alpha-ribazole phosphatase